MQNTREQFWYKNITELVNKKYIANIIPKGDMLIGAKLNAITRLVTLLTIVGFAMTRSFRIIISWCITLLALVIVFKLKAREEMLGFLKKGIREGFGSIEDKEEMARTHTLPTALNPFMNVTIPEIGDKPERNPAMTAADKDVSDEIRKAVRKSINPELEPKLFQDLGDNMIFDNSLRNFHTMPNTSVMNDQAGFAQFCYGDMKSCKEGNIEACDDKNYRYTN